MLEVFQMTIIGALPSTIVATHGFMASLITYWAEAGRIVKVLFVPFELFDYLTSFSSGHNLNRNKSFQKSIVKPQAPV
jgi:hypothetical protein